MGDTPNTTQQEFLAWYKAEVQKGLKDIKFFSGDVSQATVDSFLQESLTIDRAIAEKKHSPIAENI